MVPFVILTLSPGRKKTWGLIQAQVEKKADRVLDPISKWNYSHGIARLKQPGPRYVRSNQKFDFPATPIAPPEGR